MSRKKLIIALTAVLVLGYAGYSFAKPKPVIKTKVSGTIYQLPQSFLLNLNEGHYAKLSVALDLAPGQGDGGSAGGSGSSSSSSETTGTLPEEAIVREIVINAVAGQSGSTLVSASGRAAIKHTILAAITRQTDLKVQSVVIPEMTVQ